MCLISEYCICLLTKKLQSKIVYTIPAVSCPSPEAFSGLPRRCGSFEIGRIFCRRLPQAGRYPKISVRQIKTTSFMPEKTQHQGVAITIRRGVEPGTWSIGNPLFPTRISSPVSELPSCSRSHLEQMERVGVYWRLMVRYLLRSIIPDFLFVVISKQLVGKNRRASLILSRANRNQNATSN